MKKMEGELIARLAEAERKLAEANGQPDAKAESSGKLKGLFRRNK